MTTVAEAAMTRLNEWGVEKIFGYPGDGINGLLEALEMDGAPRFIQTRHEEIAAFAATAYGKFTDRPGVCMATSGPGAVHLLNGLYDAKLDRAPVVAIFGSQATSAQGTSFQQEIDLKTLFKDVCSDYVVEVVSSKQVPVVIDRAFRTAMAERSPVAVIMAADVQEQDYEGPDNAFKELPGSIAASEKPRIVPPEGPLNEAAQIINEGEKIGILVGQGAASASEQVKELAELTGGGVAKALLGKDVLPDDLPYVTGSIGLLGTRPSWVLAQECDVWLQIGTNFPYTQFLPDYDGPKGIQIDISAHNIGLRFPNAVNLVGDAKDTLEALIPKVERKEDRSFREEIEGEIADWWNLMEDRANEDADPVNPQLLYWKMNDHIPDNTIITADSGSSTNWFARYLKIREGMRASLSGTLATMCPAMPYSLGAKFGHPDRPVLVSVGDGAMQMLGINVLIDVAKYWQEWDNSQLVVLVLNNHDLNQVTWEQRAMGGYAKNEETQVLPDFDFATYAKGLGLGGARIEKPDQIDEVFRQAWSADRPFVIDAVTDPEIPPLPPHVMPDQAKQLAEALADGDPEAWDIIKMGTKQKLLEFLPNR
ncbi:MAG: thiamine pyrophosphate-requiring protein [Nitriliruptorales bacterium]|nr:thiamine pyrophosphate-requiring protein [Nitriliruptorales bacterium]